MQVYVVLFSMLLANLAWLVNPHACCPRMETMSDCQVTGCSMIMCSMNSINIPESSCSENCMKSDYLQITQSDQFSKGVNNFPADTTSASTYFSQDMVIAFVLDKECSAAPTNYTSFIVPPIEKPPSLDYLGDVSNLSLIQIELIGGLHV